MHKNGEAVTAFFTIVLAISTIALWRATERLWVATNKSFVIEKRAFVFPGGIVGRYEADTGTGHFNWRLTTVWQNSGDTPTRNLRYYMDCIISNTTMSPNFDLISFDAVAIGTGMLGPKTSATAGLGPHMDRPAISPQDILAIQQGVRFLYVWGWARYDDALPDSEGHVTRFCWRVLIDGNPFLFNPIVDSQSIRFNNAYLPRGNCADEECTLQGLG